jgi:hypothetical protein
VTSKQEDQAAVVPATEDVTADAKASDGALAQYRKDNEVRAKDPDKVVVREANEDFGGESFAYLDNVRV